VLKEIIENSGLTYKEISEKCEKSGHKVDPSYISKLVNMKLSPASEKINTSIAEACNANPDRMILEAYLDKAPKQLLDFINTIKANYNADFSDNKENVSVNVDNQPISTFILDFKPSNFNLGEGIKGVVMPDVSMEPYIEKGDRLIIEPFELNTKEYIHYSYNPLNKEIETPHYYIDKIGFHEHAKYGDMIALYDFKREKLLVGFYNTTYQYVEEIDEKFYYMKVITGNWESENYTFGFDSTRMLFDLVDINNFESKIDTANVKEVSESKVIYLEDGSLIDLNSQSVICILGKVTNILKSI